MASGDYIAYYRVSTKRQGASGLGLDAQKEAVARFLNGGDWRLLADFTEVESGKNNNRPMLGAALRACRMSNATLIVAKLDRLSRDLEFLVKLQNSKTKFICADMPEANPLTIHIYAAMAQHERSMISTRIKEALAMARARGTVLGNPRLDECRNSDVTAAIARNKLDYEEYLSDIQPIIQTIRDEGVTTLSGIAEELNRRGFQTRRGKKWTAQQVKNYTNSP